MITSNRVSGGYLIRNAGSHLGSIALLVALASAPADALAQEEAEVEDPSPPDAPPSPPAADPPRQPAPTPSARPTRETICNDGIDNDGDGLTDCADADCFDTQYCEAGGGMENTDATCSDWIDNDGDGAIDCEDPDCHGPGVTVCRGSWSSGQGQQPSSPAPTPRPGADAIPELEGDMSVEDLIGRFGDVDGERNDYLCSDGIDNDGDGRIDCEDFGCRFDPSVTVCQQGQGPRFSLVAGIAGSLRIDETPDFTGDGFTEFFTTGDVRFTRIQLRALGSIPQIPNSFFLLNIRAERTFRMTFATFNVPLGNQGHYISINSGNGGLSPGLIVSTAKQPLLDPPFYLFNAFEQGAGAALEVGGPITEDGTLRFRVFGMGGSGEFAGNVGGRFFRTDERNFSYAGGAQLQVNLIGHYDRFDTPFLYTPVPMALAVMAGGRFDQRPVERFAAWNGFAIWRWWHFLIRAEAYGRYVFDFDGLQQAWNVQASVLLIPRTLMLAADVGGFHAPLEYLELPTTGFSTQFRRPLEEFHWRVALHWYYFRNIGIMSLMYAEARFEENPDRPEDAIVSREVRLEAQFRF